MKHIMDEERRSSRVKDSDSSNEKEKKKRKRKRNAKKKKSSDNLRNSFTAEVLMINPLGNQRLILDGLKATTTIKDVKARVYQEAIARGFSHLENRALVGRSRFLKDNETLGSFFYPGCKDLTIDMCYTLVRQKKIFREDPNEEEDTDWLPVCKLVRFREEAHEEDVGRDDDSPVSIVKRPKPIQAPLPFAELHDLGINGNYVLLDDQFDSISISKIRDATFVSANASAVLVALNDDIYKNLVSLNSDSESQYLVVRVSWDKLSYFFLWLLRASCREIPIVAVTDLDPHHLDLLTFLDTPLEKLPICYGWDLSKGYENIGDVCNVDFLNIRWLGPSLSDCVKLRLAHGVAYPPPGFKEVIRMLRVNPFFRRKRDWLAALEWLDVHCKSVALAPYFGNDFIAKKLSQKDWV